jgi:predicted ABC-type transport system involved in lysophospholipase L1 biosynthesis ATPase subunit
MVLQVAESTAVTETTAAPVVLTNVTKRYGRRRRGVAALDGVSLSFGAGSFTAVLGVSGSGKSPLLQCAAGLERASSGTVRLCGTDLAALSHHWSRAWPPARADAQLRRVACSGVVSGSPAAVRRCSGVEKAILATSTP